MSDYMSQKADDQIEADIQTYNSMWEEIQRLTAQRDAWKECAEHTDGLLRLQKYGEEDYPVLGALDAWAAGRHPILKDES